MTRSAIILFLIPALLEIIYPRQFLIPIPGMPYSLGELTFICIGFTGLIEFRISALGQVGKAFLLIYSGMFFASFLNSNILEDLSTSFGTVFYFIATLGWSRLFLKKQYLYWLDILMISIYVYWMSYLFNTVFTGGTITSYSTAYSYDMAVNHHIPGIAVSTSTFYLLMRFFTVEYRFKPLGLVFLGMSILLMLVLQSRSNFVVCVLLALVSHNWIKKEKVLNFLRLVPFFLLGYLIIEFLMDNFDFIRERFSVNSDYQERTTVGRRMVYIRFPYEFMQNPLGRGPNNYKVDLGEQTINAHNTYLTFIIIGGVGALIGVLGFLTKQIRIGLKGKWFRRVMYHNYPKQIYSGYIASLVFFITLFTIELNNLLFYVCLSILLTTESIFDYFSKKKLTLD